MPANWNDMCLLQDVKNWIFGNSVDNTWPVNSDAFLSMEITAASRGIMQALQRSTLLAHAVDEIRSGVGGVKMVLREWPLLSMTSLTIDGVSINARGPLSQPGYQPGGWVIENPWDGIEAGSHPVLISTGMAFTCGLANVEIKYNAGYAVLGEAAVVPASSAYTIVPAQPYGRFAKNFQVAYASGALLTPVTGTPSVGQYKPPALPPSSSVTDASYVPTYTFAAGDANAAVLLSYSITPFEITQACAKWVGEWWAYKSRPGQKSKAGPAGGGSSSYDLSDMPNDVKLMINNYVDKLPMAV